MAELESPIRIGSATIRNRLYRAPVLEGAGSEPGYADVYKRAFTENAATGVGLIIQGNSCLYEEGRTSPGMTLVNTKQRMMALADMTAEVHRLGASIFIQVGHGGLYAMEAWHEPYASRRKYPIKAVSKPPPWIAPAFARVPIRVMSTADVYAMARRYGQVAGWAREAGYDGIQLASGNAKLLHQFISPFYNRRDDEFGGSVENRARVLKVIREEIAKVAGDDYPVSVKVSVGEKAPPLTPHIGFDEGLRICELAEEWGYDAITPVEVSVFPDTALSRGGIPSSLWENKAIRSRFDEATSSLPRKVTILTGYVLGGFANPFRPVWNRRVFKEAKRRLSVPVFAVGGIRTAEEVRSILENEEADMVGIGRPFYAEPDLALRILSGSKEPRRCRNSNRCVPPQMLGMKGTCYNPAVKKTRVDLDAVEPSS